MENLCYLWKNLTPFPIAHLNGAKKLLFLAGAMRHKSVTCFKSSLVLTLALDKELIPSEQSPHPKPEDYEIIIIIIPLPTDPTPQSR